MPIERIRLSEREREQLITLKRRTKLKNWNVLCRWALCTSLAEPTPPPKAEIVSDSSVEMTWRVFAGQYEDLYLALLKQRCLQDGLEIDDDVLMTQFRLHLNRGIGYLYGDRSMKNIGDLVRRAVDA